MPLLVPCTHLSPVFFLLLLLFLYFLSFPVSSPFCVLLFSPLLSLFPCFTLPFPLPCPLFPLPLSLLPPSILSPLFPFPIPLSPLPQPPPFPFPLSSVFLPPHFPYRAPLFPSSPLRVILVNSSKCICLRFPCVCSPTPIPAVCPRPPCKAGSIYRFQRSSPKELMERNLVCLLLLQE